MARSPLDDISIPGIATEVICIDAMFEENIIIWLGRPRLTTNIATYAMEQPMPPRAYASAEQRLPFQFQRPSLRWLILIIYVP
jgi:hypothetical protein